ncbi:MAG: stage III sporulation protein AF [bacterium]
MNFLINWVKQIIFTVLIFTILDMFLPNENIKKYVRIVMGFFIALIFISPILSFFNMDFASLSISEEIIPSEYASQVEKNSKKVEQFQDNNLMRIYKKRIVENISTIIEKDFVSFIVQEVDITLNDEYQITNVAIRLIDKSVKQVKIEPINITISSSKSEEADILTEKEEEIKSRINEELQVKKEKISIEIIEKH